jgi:serine/threonine protein kinase
MAEALRYAIGLAEALREVHGRSRIYAFLQPGGIAIQDGRIRLLPSGPVVVSPYFSPEQVAGYDLDPRSDIYSLGAVLYEMLSGRRAFDAPTRIALRMEILDREPATLEGVPAALARLVRRCLEKKPERRVQRMEILLAELKLLEIVAVPGDGGA